MCKLTEEKGERTEVTRKAAQEKKEAKRQAEAMAKQKAQAALTDCATPQKRPQKQGGSAAKKAKVQGQPPPPSRLQTQSVALPQLLLKGWGAASAAGASQVALSVARLSTRRGRRESLRRWSFIRRRRSFSRSRRRSIDATSPWTSVRGQRCVSRCATSSGYAARGCLTALWP